MDSLTQLYNKILFIYFSFL